MKKYLFGLFAIAFAIGFSAFTKPSAHITKGKKFTTGQYWYTFSGAQTVSDRQVKTNYTSPVSSEPTCSGITNECAAKVTVTLDIHNNPPANISSTNVTFDATTGFPNGGSDLLQNDLKP